MTDELNKQPLEPDGGLITTPSKYNQYMYGVKSNAFSKAQYPKLNAKERSKKLYDEFKAWQESQGIDYKEKIARLRKKTANKTADILRPIVEKIRQNAKEWTGTQSVSGWVENRIKKAGGLYSRHDALSGSVYFDLIDSNGNTLKTLRVSDHKQIAGGGFNIELQSRSGEADVDLTPQTELNRYEALDLFLSPNPASSPKE